MPKMVITYYGEETAADAIYQFLKEKQVVDGCSYDCNHADSNQKCICKDLSVKLASVAINSINRG